MKITLQRLYHTQGNLPKDYTGGFLALEQGKFNCFVVEDVPRLVKIPGNILYYKLPCSKSRKPPV